jgi:hypothetical protein
MDAAPYTKAVAATYTAWPSSPWPFDGAYNAICETDILLNHIGSMHPEKHTQSDIFGLA